MEENLNLVGKEATGRLTRAQFIDSTYISMNQRKKILLLSDDL